MTSPETPTGGGEGREPEWLAQARLHAAKTPASLRRSGHTPRYRIARRAVGKLLLRSLGQPIFRAWSRAWRYEELHVERKRSLQREGGFILALWHGRMLCPVPLYRGEDFTILVSPSDDGDLSEALLKSFGYEVVRGSASRGGAHALRQLLGALGRGSIVAITPDGPRGPRHSTNPGLAWIARATGHAILPAGYAASPRRELDSWDRFTLPGRGARIVASYGEALRVPREGGRELLDEVSTQLRRSMLAAEQEAFARLGEEPDF